MTKRLSKTMQNKKSVPIKKKIQTKTMKHTRSNRTRNHTLKQSGGMFGFKRTRNDKKKTEINSIGAQIISKYTKSVATDAPSTVTLKTICKSIITNACNSDTRFDEGMNKFILSLTNDEYMYLKHNMHTIFNKEIYKRRIKINYYTLSNDDNPTKSVINGESSRIKSNIIQKKYNDSKGFTYEDFILNKKSILNGLDKADKNTIGYDTRTEDEIIISDDFEDGKISISIDDETNTRIFDNGVNLTVRYPNSLIEKDNKDVEDALRGL